MLKLRKRERDFLFTRFEMIRTSPGRLSNSRQHDESGRLLDIHIAEKFAILYWDDFADRHVKIMDIRRIDHRK